jgi:hypothetical protein
MREPAAAVRLDLNNPVFQRQLFGLERQKQLAVLGSLRKLAQVTWTWDQVHTDPGVRWEAIISRQGVKGGRLYSLRLGRGFRAVACRDGEWLRLLTLHPDHDSAYR